MNQNISKRFERFMFFLCRTTGTNNQFGGPEWARIAYNAVLVSNDMPTFRGCVE